MESIKGTKVSMNDQFCPRNWKRVNKVYWLLKTVEHTGYSKQGNGPNNLVK